MFLEKRGLFQLLISVDKASEQSTSDDPYLILEIRDLGTHLIVHSWDIHAKVTIGFIQMLDNHWKGNSQFLL